MIPGNEPFERVVLEVEAQIEKAFDARLRTIEARLAETRDLEMRIAEFMTKAEEIIGQLMESPMMKMMVETGGAGFGAFGGLGGSA